MDEANIPTSEQGYATTKASNVWWSYLVADEETPELRWPDSIAVYDRMATDAQVRSVTQAVRLPILSTGWYLEANGADAEVVAHIAETMGLRVRGVDVDPPLRTRDRFSFAEHLDVVMDYLTYGHSVFEQVYRIEGGLAGLRKLAERPQRSISKFNVARDGGLTAIEQHPLGTTKAVRIPIDRLVVYVNEKRGGNWVGRSILRSAYKYWLLKDRTLRVQAQVGDRNGLGIPVYESAPVPDGYDHEQAEEFMASQQTSGLDLAKKLRSGEEAGAAIPNGAKLDVKGVQGTLPDLEKQIRYYDEQIARSALANFLSLGGENSRGSFALGETFENFFQQSLQATAQNVRDVLNQHVVEDLVDINWGPTVRAPRIVFDDIGSRHPVTAQAIYQLVMCGALLPEPALEEYLRTTYGLPQKAPRPQTTTTASASVDSPTNAVRRTLAQLSEQLRLLDEQTQEEDQ